MQTHNVRFAVSLSNGTNYIENRDDILDDETSSSWNKLIKIMVAEKAHITAFALFSGEKRFHLPYAGANPKFAFIKPIKPLDYNFFRATAREMKMTDAGQGPVTMQDWFTVAEAVYPGFKLQLWVNENDTNDCRTVITE